MMMEVYVHMTELEYEEYRAWLKDRGYYRPMIKAKENLLETIAKDIALSIGRPEEGPEQIEVLDQNRAARLMEFAFEYFI